MNTDARKPSKDRAKALGILESVQDEGHFREKCDAKAMEETVGQWNSHVAAVVGQFEDRVPGDIVAPITEYPNFEHLEADGWKEEGRGRGS